MPNKKQNFKTNNSMNIINWDKLCEQCYSIIKNAKMTEQDIDKIAKKTKRG